MKIAFQRLRIVMLALACVLVTAGCEKRKPETTAPVVAPTQKAIDLDEIETGGTLIAVTMSGPETYYIYKGKEFGLHFALAELFAQSRGLRLRVEIAADTTEMLEMVHAGKADLIACPMSAKEVTRYGLRGAGFHSAGNEAEGDTTTWCINPSAPLLGEALNEWFTPALTEATRKAQETLRAGPSVKRTPRAAFANRQKGIISPYDHLFASAARSIGWDWRLLAAQCYQESAFDPKAVSWAGARGLMQIMPKTAEHLGVRYDELDNPEVNINASARYLRELYNQFSDIANPEERRKFTLAAYNGGYLHIRDAMRLAEKYGRNAKAWSSVSTFVLHLSEPRYYRDPVCRNGYMIGSETYHYVERILTHYAGYQGIKRPAHNGTATLDARPTPSKRQNRFTQPTQILTPDDSLFRME